ncbi:hypothetical protein ACFUTV_13635 [Streptomyces sp. NPDC057298]
MSEALRRVVEALGDGGEEEVAAVLETLGAQHGPESSAGGGRA